MEQNAYEALFLGVNVFVFIIALTAGILLMTNLMNMVNYANENAIVGMAGSLAETVGNVQDRIYTGSQMITCYNKFVESEERAKEKDENTILDIKYFVKTGENDKEKSISDYIATENIVNYYNKKFELVYKGKNNNTEQYVFVKINEDNNT